VNGGYTTLCLAYRDGILYMCAGGGLGDGFALGCSTDDGASFNPMLVWDELMGPEGCPADSPGRNRCEASWLEVRPLLVPPDQPPRTSRPCVKAAETPDAGVVDAAEPDAAAADVAPEVGGADLGAPQPGAEGCSCRLARDSRGVGRTAGLAALVALVVARGRRRSRRGARLDSSLGPLNP
jgi:hypothetical protein